MFDALFLDFDGVVADSHEILFDAYRTFLAQHGGEGTWEEFYRLDGHSLREAIAIYKERLNLSESVDQLWNTYHAVLIDQYKKVDLFAGVKELTAALEVPVWIVSAGTRPLVQTVLNHHGLKVDGIVTSEDVELAKPAPDIYLKALERSGCRASRVLVVEDSDNGMRSALGAGIPTIGAAWKKGAPQIPLGVAFVAESWDEVALFFRHRVRRLKPDISIELIDRPLDLTPFEPLIEQVWQRASEDLGDVLFNGQVLAVSRFEGNRLQGFFIEYRLALALARCPELAKKLPLTMVGTGGLTRAEGKVLVGKRSQAVGLYGGCYELAPGGTLDQQNFQEHLLRELKEETGLTAATVTPLLAVWNPEVPVVDLCCGIDLSHCAEVLANDEYTQFEWLSPKEALTRKPAVPSLKQVLEVYG